MTDRETQLAPYYRISVEELAQWLEAHGDVWWSADTDPGLDGVVDYFPCSGKTFAEGLRALGHEFVHIFVDKLPARQPAEPIDRTRLEAIADRDNRYDAREFLCRWPGQTEGWILAEEVPTTKAMNEDEAEAPVHAAS